MKIIDVTLRESVYYGSGIDYVTALEYLKNMAKYISNEDIQYVEFGYLNTDEQGNLNYDEKYIMQAYDICKDYFGLVAMMHPGKADITVWNPEIVSRLDLVRITINGNDMPDNVKEYIEYLHNLDVKASINIAYALNRTEEERTLMLKKSVEFGADYIYFADSSGSAGRNDICKLISELKENRGTNAIGIHLHDHLGMAFANAITCYEEKLDITDVSITGAGKGGGNLKAEILVPYLRMIEKRDLTEGLYKNLYEFIRYFSELIGRNSENHVQTFLDSFVGIYKIRLKKQEELDREARGDIYKYIELVVKNCI